MPTLAFNMEGLWSMGLKHLEDIWYNKSKKK